MSAVLFAVILLPCNVLLQTVRNVIDKCYNGKRFITSSFTSAVSVQAHIVSGRLVPAAASGCFQLLLLLAELEGVLAENSLV